MKAFDDTCVERVNGGVGRVAGVCILDLEVGGIAGDQAQTKR